MERCLVVGSFVIALPLSTNRQTIVFCFFLFLDSSLGSIEPSTEFFFPFYRQKFGRAMNDMRSVMTVDQVRELRLENGSVQTTSTTSTSNGAATVV